ncbi:hypothetical protein BDZ88DRAFT_337057 [Geranomyces variabilis]|nr:hypothetical protein BDZ88DRAFT_337057 [Geranomyces variabilis]
MFNNPLAPRDNMDDFAKNNWNFMSHHILSVDESNPQSGYHYIENQAALDNFVAELAAKKGWGLSFQDADDPTHLGIFKLNMIDPKYSTPSPKTVVFQEGVYTLKTPPQANPSSLVGTTGSPSPSSTAPALPAVQTRIVQAHNAWTVDNYEKMCKNALEQYRQWHWNEYPSTGKRPQEQYQYPEADTFLVKDPREATYPDVVHGKALSAFSQGLREYKKKKKNGY